MRKYCIIKTLIIASLLFFLGSPQEVHSLRTPTHRVINGYIAVSELNGFNFNAYAMNTLRLQGGVGHRFSQISNAMLYQWLESGGQKEDEPFDNILMRSLIVTEGARWMNHFHDPIHDSGLWWGNSAIEWAFKPQLSQSYLTGNFSYHDVTNYFYKALTSQTEYDRQYYYIYTFRGLGQLMHLVQDMSVPAHVRNDAHPLSAKYEAWFVEDNNNDDVPDNFFRDPTDPSRYALYLTNCENIYGINDPPLWPLPYLQLQDDIPIIFFDTTALESATPHPLSDVPVSNLFDADIYDEDSNSNPELTVRGDAGLSEYTNVNFLSPDSLIDYDYPKLITLDEDPRDPEHASMKLAEVYDQHDDHYGKYYKKYRHGETIDYFARVLRIEKFINNLNMDCQIDPTLCPNMSVPDLGFTLDDPRVHANYAQKLIPRAVGYSSQLLSYFFEKHLELLEISVPDDGFYAMTTDPEVGFNSLKLRVRNKSQQVEFTDGDITLVVKYKTLPDGCETLPPDPDNICPPSDVDFQQIIISSPSVREIPNESPLEVQFDLGTKTIPLDAVDVHIYLVYKGKGCTCNSDPCICESESIVFGYKDVREPTPYSVANSMDWICIEVNGSKNWYRAGSDAAISARDAVGGNVDIYPHSMEDIYIRFSPYETSRRKTASAADGQYHAFIEGIQPGHYAQKVFLLTDAQLWASCFFFIRPIDPADEGEHVSMHTGYSAPGIRYQIDLDADAGHYVFHGSKFEEIRGALFFNGLIMHNMSNRYMDPECGTEGCYCPKDDYDYSNDIFIRDAF